MIKLIATILFFLTSSAGAEPWIHNNTGSEVTFDGVGIPPGEFAEITPAEWVAYAEDPALLAAIQAGNVAFSKDGSTDLSVSESVTMYHTLVQPERQHFTWNTFAAKNVRDAIIEAKETPAPLDYDWASSESESSTTSNSFQTKVTLNKTVNTSAEYRIGWSFEASVSSNNKAIEYRILLDGSTILGQPMLEPRTAEWHPVSGFYTTTLTAGSHTVVIQYRDASNKAALIRRARIDILKVD